MHKKWNIKRKVGMYIGVSNQNKGSGLYQTTIIKGLQGNNSGDYSGFDIFLGWLKGAGSSSAPKIEKPLSKLLLSHFMNL